MKVYRYRATQLYNKHTATIFKLLTLQEHCDSIMVPTASCMPMNKVKMPERMRVGWIRAHNRIPSVFQKKNSMHHRI